MQTPDRATPDTTQAGLKESATGPAAQASPAATPDPEPSAAALPTNPRLTLKAAVRWSQGRTRGEDACTPDGRPEPQDRSKNRGHRANLGHVEHSVRRIHPT